MSALPKREDAELYTQDDVQHIVAREMAKQQIVQLQNGQLEINKKLVEMTASFMAEIKAMREMLEHQPDTVKNACQDIKRDIEKEFPSRIEIVKMESRIEEQISEIDHKVERQWIKITTTISAISVCITALGVAMNYWLVAEKIIK